jgi:hypothetical protein
VRPRERAERVRACVQLVGMPPVLGHVRRVRHALQGGSAACGEEPRGRAAEREGARRLPARRARATFAAGVPVDVGRWAAVVAIAGALGACRAKPRPEPPQPPAAGRASDAPPAEAAEARAAPGASGDRHARAAARRKHVVKRTTGKLARADERVVVIGGPDAPPLTLRIAPGTTVTLDGQPARPEALPPGAEVRAAYRTGDGGRPTAISVEVRRPPEAPPATAPAAPPAEPPPEPSGG